MSFSMKRKRNQWQTTYARALSWGGAAGHCTPGLYCDTKRPQLGLLDTRFTCQTDDQQNLVGWLCGSVAVPTVKSP